MTESDPEPMSEDLLTRVRAERHVGPAPSAGKARVRARVDATLFVPGGGGGSSVPDAGTTAAKAGTSLGRFAVVFALGVVVGGATVYALVQPKLVEHRVEIAHAPEAPRSAENEPVNVTAPRVARATEPSATATTSTSATVPSSGLSTPPADSLVAERALLDPARTALGRGDASSALAAVKQHEQRYPQGQLVEEREAIAVQALVLSGRKDEARGRGKRFLTRYPGSVLVPTIQAALEAAE